MALRFVLCNGRGLFLSIVFDLERTNQLNLLPDKDLVDLCPPIEPYQVTKNQIFMSATPYHSWERGLNEHTKGLLRQFFPKKTNFKIVKPEQVERAVNLINNRPRKCLDYRTPNKVFYEGRSDSDAIQT
ncbi:MAG: IS30 family transposase [Microcystis aeruginosa S11-05]|nr:IS30 family transposase [Microcystis aeruginosa S11-05]